MTFSDFLYLALSLTTLAIYAAPLWSSFRERSAQRTRLFEAGKQWAKVSLRSMSPSQVRAFVSATNRTPFEKGIEEAIREHYEANPHLDH